MAGQLAVLAGTNFLRAGKKVGSDQHFLFHYGWAGRLGKSFLQAGKRGWHLHQVCVFLLKDSNWFLWYCMKLAPFWTGPVWLLMTGAWLMFLTVSTRLFIWLVCCFMYSFILSSRAFTLVTTLVTSVSSLHVVL